MAKKFNLIKRILLLVVLVWTIMITAIISISVYRNYNYAKHIAIENAKTSVNKDLAYRSWISSHGGVYVPTDNRTPPNKYLSHLKNRDIRANGQNYTLMNPAYSLSQMMKDYTNLYGVKTKITSKLLLNPKNRADEWEAYALEKISLSKKQFYELSNIDDEPYLRLMNPLITQKSCLKCHAKQGYRVGDLRGGVSVSIPMKELYKDVRKDNIFEISIFFFIWLIGSLFLFYTYKKLHFSFVEKQRMYEQYIYGLVDIVEQRDYYTAGHSKRVAQYSKMLASAMGYDKEEQTLIYRAAMLHDIGKIAIPDSVFLKPTKLSDSEYQLIKEHVTISYDMIKNIEVFNDIAIYIKNHHEHYDGSGYPQGLKGDESPMLAQILSLCDAFDAMTTNRIYKHKKDVPTALKELSTFSGKQFNPTVVEFALKTFENLVIHEVDNEIFHNKLDKERFQYFFKDTLTGLFNKDYLNNVLKKDYNYKFLYQISLKNFTQYNKKYGWDAGDIKLQQIAKVLNDNFFLPNGLVFRIFGDDFIVLNQKTVDMDVLLKPIIEDFNQFEIKIESKVLDLRKNKITNFNELDNAF